MSFGLRTHGIRCDGASDLFRYMVLAIKGAQIIWCSYLLFQLRMIWSDNRLYKLHLFYVALMTYNCR